MKFSKVVVIPGDKSILPYVEGYFDTPEKSREHVFGLIGLKSNDPGKKFAFEGDTMIAMFDENGKCHDSWSRGIVRPNPEFDPTAVKLDWDEEDEYISEESSARLKSFFREHFEKTGIPETSDRIDNPEVRHLAGKYADEFGEICEEMERDLAPRM